MTVRPLPPRFRPPRRAHAWVAAALTLLGLTASAAAAQDARMLGMGGVAVAGPAAADMNPAFAAVPGKGGSSLTLPLGALSAVTQSYWNPTSPTFDALSTLDQASSLALYLLDPAVSPDRVIVGVDAQGLSVSFQGGSPMQLTSTSTYNGGIDLPVGGAVGPVHFGVRPFLSVHATLQPNADTAKVFQGGSLSASGTFGAEAEAGVALDVGTALALPIPSSMLAGAKLYAGVRGSAIVGLAKAAASFQGKIRAEKDSSGHYTGNVLYSYSGTYEVGGLLNNSIGYGGQAALGMAATVPSQVGPVTLGLSVRHLGVMVWNVDQTQVKGDQQSSSTTPLGTAQQVEVARHVDLGANLALTVPSDQLGAAGMSLLLATDGDVDLSGGFAAHAGAELRYGIFAARAGLGYQDGLRLGLGAGVDAAPVGIDVALTSHRSPLTDHQAFGVAASLAFGF